MSDTRRVVCFCGLILALACNFAKAQDPKAQFPQFFSGFKDAVRANDVERIADLMHFPFYEYSAKHSRAAFVSNKDGSINFFDDYVRGQILQSRDSDFVTYRNKKEMDEDKPDFALIPEAEPVVELDIVRQRGGPALRLVFARAGSTYRLFCLVQ